MTVRRLLPPALAAVLVAGGLTLLVSPSPAAAAGEVGRYTSLAPTRVLNTRASTPIASGGTRSFTVPSSVPDAATSVVLNLTVAGATSTGYVTAYSGDARPGVSNVNYVTARTVSNLATVRLVNRTVTVYNQGGTVDVFADLSGYVAPGPSGSDSLGAIAPLTPRRVLDTRNAIGVSTRTPVAAGRAVTVRVSGGSTALPPDASAVVVNLTAASPAASGYLTAYPTNAPRPGTSNLTFAAARGVAGLAVVPIGDFGSITIYNGSTKPVQVLADVQGYVSGGEPASVGALSALQPQRLVDTRSSRAVAGNGTLTVPVLGRGGVPVADVAAVVLTLTVAAPTRNGFLRAFGPTEPSTSDLAFATGQTVSNLVVVRPDSAGRVTVRNGSPGSAQVLVDVAGYVLDRDVTVPAVTVSRYTTDLTALAGTGSGSEGCVDGGSGARFVLLDVGAQSRTSPLSGANPGVALARTVPTKRATYAQLTTAVKAYLSEFARCGSQAARIAVGTNTSGAYSGTTAYPAASRGLDWARAVVVPLRKSANSRLEVVGANDVEAGFSGSEADAEAWTKAFLSYDTSVKLVYNGSLDACSDDYLKSLSCRAVKDENGVSKTWTPAQYVRLTYSLGVSGSRSRISVLPQIYFSVPNQAAQWRNLYVESGRKLTFEGTLTQFGVAGVNGGYSGQQGWSALYHALSTLSATPPLPAVATDLVGT